MAQQALSEYSILVATPTPAFGDLIRHSLEESGSLHVRLARNVYEAQVALDKTNTLLAILDSDLEDIRLRELALALVEVCPSLKLILIPPGNDPNHPDVVGIPASAYLSKPFYLPDLIDLVNRLAAESLSALGTPGQRSSAQHSAGDLGWLNVELLASLLSLTNARAAAVCHHAGTEVIAGDLPPEAQASLSVFLRRFWQRDERSDVVRFTRLENGSQPAISCLFYQTALAADGESAVCLLFPIEMALSKVRAQTAPLVQALRELENELPAAIPPAPPVREDTIASIQSAQASAPEPPLLLSELPGNDIEEEWELDERLSSFNLADLLGSIPSPDPASLESISETDAAPILATPATTQAAPPNGSLHPADEGDDWLPETLFQPREMPPPQEPAPLSDEITWLPPAHEAPQVSRVAPPPKDELRQLWEQEVMDAARSTPQPPAGQPRGAFFRAEELPAAPLLEQAPPAISPEAQLPIDIPRPSSEAAAVAPISNESPTPAAFAAVTSSAPLGMSNLDDEESDASGARGSVLSTLTSLTQLEPSSLGLSLLNYTCVLVPRMPQHYLTGELSERISQWVQQLCLAFGWRLEGIALRPEYLQWTVQVSPTISPGNVVKVIRQRISEQIFAQFENIRQQNPSGDFWAPGYLIVSGTQPPSAGLLREYIQQTRRRQGIGKLPGDAAPRLNS